VKAANGKLAFRDELTIDDPRPRFPWCTGPFLCPINKNGLEDEVRPPRKTLDRENCQWVQKEYNALCKTNSQCHDLEYQLCAEVIDGICAVLEAREDGVEEWYLSVEHEASRDSWD